MRAMILAAGLGTRMAPLTRHVAKPALPLLDEPLVRRMARQLADQGVERIVANAHARADSLARALEGLDPPVELSHEPELLGSGGGIAAARAHLDGHGPFLVINADMVIDLDVAALLEAHRARPALATLALRDDPRKRQFGSIGYDENAAVRRITSLIDLGGESGSGLFTGAHVIEPGLFDQMPGGAFEIIPSVYLPALRDGARLGTWLQPERDAWWPVGSPGELLEANLLALQRQGEHRAADARVEGETRGRVWIGSGARVEKGALVGPEAVIGRDSVVPAGCRLEQSLVLPGARPPAESLRRAVSFADEVWRDA